MKLLLTISILLFTITATCQQDTVKCVIMVSDTAIAHDFNVWKDELPKNINPNWPIKLKVWYLYGYVVYNKEWVEEKTEEYSGGQDATIHLRTIPAHWQRTGIDKYLNRKKEELTYNLIWMFKELKQ